jgi:hypothetical protein
MLESYIPKVIAIVLTYNDDTIVQQCIDSLLKCNYENLEILLVDNNSNDNIAEKLQIKYPTIISLRLNENLGYAGGLNHAIKYIKKIRTDVNYFLLLNNDVSLNEDVITKLVKVAEKNKKIGFIGPESFKRDGSGMHDFWVPKRKNRYNPIDIILNDNYDYSHKEYEHVEFVSGHCLMVRNETIEDVGLMRPEFFIYWEESEWQWRAKLKGWSAVVCPNSIVYHDRLSFSKPNNSYLRNRNLLFYNRIILSKNLLFFPFFIFNIAVQFKLFFKLFFIKEKKDHIYPVFKSFIHGLFFKLPYIEYLD